MWGKIFGFLGAIAAIIAILGFLFGWYTINEMLPSERREVVAYCRLMANFNDLMKSPPEKSPSQITDSIASIDTKGLKESGRFQTAKVLLIDAANAKGYKQGYLSGKVSHILGEIMKCCDITKEEVKEVGSGRIVKQMDAIKKLMEITGTWTTTKCN